MKTFTIDTDNNISVFASKKEAAPSTTPFDPFASQSDLAELAADWPMSRLIEIWNSIPGVNAVTKFTNRKIATDRIWKAIQNLGAVAPKPPVEASEAFTEVWAPAEPAPVPAIVETQVSQDAGLGEEEAQAIADAPEPAIESEPTPDEPVANVEAQAPDVAPVAADPAPKPTRAKKAPKKAAQPETSGPREGSKTAQVVAMLQREGCATLAEIMETMSWQKHTVRGFMAGP